MRQIALPLAFAVLSLAFAPAPLPKRERPPGDDLKKIQGRWVRTRCVLDGREYHESPGATAVTITGDRLQFPVEYDRWLISLDARTKRFDFRSDSALLGESFNRGVYRLEGGVKGHFLQVFRR